MSRRDDSDRIGGSRRENAVDARPAVSRCFDDGSAIACIALLAGSDATPPSLGPPRDRTSSPRRSPSRSPGEPGLRADDRAVSPLVAYILLFAVTSGLVVVELSAMSAILDDRHRAAANLQLEDLAHRVANAIEEAFHVIDENPDADYEKRLPLPRDIRGFTYQIDVNDTHVQVNATPLTAGIEAGTVLHNPGDRDVSGSVQQRAAAEVVYDPATGAITLKGGD